MSRKYTPSSVDLEVHGIDWDVRDFSLHVRERKEWTARLSWFFKEDGLVVWLGCDPKKQMRGMVLINEGELSSRVMNSLHRKQWEGYNPTGQPTSPKYELKNMLTDEGLEWLLTRKVACRKDFIALFGEWQ